MYKRQDWSFIGYCTNLTRFSGENSGIDDLSALEACGKLKELNVSRTEETGQAGITDITPLTFCQDLSSVPVSYTHLDVYKRQILCNKGSISFGGG